MSHTPVHLNDPDFDPPAPTPGTASQSFIQQLPPKYLFIAGLVGGVLVLGTIGFFILLGIFLKGGQTTVNPAPIAVVNNQPSPSPTAQPIARAPTGTVPPVTKADHIRGDKNAALTWVEYSDFECPFCKRFHPTMLQMMQEYKGKIKWVYRHFPLSFHQNAEKEAEVVECANELGGNDAFWKYTDTIFERTASNGTGIALDVLVPMAKEIGLNETKFKNCLDSGKYAAHVAQDENGGSGAGVNGTPGSFLIDKDGKAQSISGAVPYEQIKAAIVAALR
ncbi:MAG: thioredoxin domain-containing protein [Candidatus Magasanikbacteria bacterium]|nr:thioredoxin domain-containing protein [Candidatus Magasanikbacteria bacterium]